MKAIFLIPALVAPVILNAEEAAPMSMEERKASIVQIQKKIEMREERLNEVVSDIRVLDDRTEKRIGKIVDTLKGLQDSESSKTRIVRLKGEVIEGLRKSVEAYADERNKIFERLKKSGLGKEDSDNALTAQMDKVDERIQKRVDQIVELAKTLPTRKDTKKYESDGGSYRSGWAYENSRISEEWRQNRRQGSATKVQIDELTKALKDAIERLEFRRTSVTSAIKNPRTSETEKTLQKHELGRIDALIEHRRHELVELSMPSSPGGEATDKDTADHLRELLDSARRDLRNDHWTVVQKLDQAFRELERIAAMKENLIARQKWLEEHGE